MCFEIRNCFSNYNISFNQLTNCVLLFHVQLQRRTCLVMEQETTGFSKQPIRARYLGHVTGYRPIRDQYFLIRSVPIMCSLSSLTQSPHAPHNVQCDGWATDTYNGDWQSIRASQMYIQRVREGDRGKERRARWERFISIHELFLLMTPPPPPFVWSDVCFCWL